MWRGSCWCCWLVRERAATSWLERTSCFFFRVVDHRGNQLAVLLHVCQFRNGKYQDGSPIVRTTTTISASRKKACLCALPIRRMTLSFCARSYYIFRRSSVHTRGCWVLRVFETRVPTGLDGGFGLSMPAAKRNETRALEEREAEASLPARALQRHKLRYRRGESQFPSNVQGRTDGQAVSKRKAQYSFVATRMYPLMVFEVKELVFVGCTF